MPIVTEATPEQHKSIIRPVVIEVVNQILPVMRLSNDDELIFNGFADIAMLSNSMIGVNRNPDSPIRPPGPSQIMVNIEESATSTTSPEMAVLYPENRFIMRDARLGIGVRPVRKRTLLNITFNKRFRSKAAADRWHSNMEQLMARYVQDYIHTLDYHYNIPDGMLVMLSEFWKLREAQAPYNQNFGEWLSSCMAPYQTVTTNQAGKQAQLSFAESLDNVQGWWDFDVVPYPVRENTRGNWQVTFDYKVEFDKVIELVMNYPIIIHNQMLPPEMIPQPRLPSYRNKVYQKNAMMYRAEAVQQEVEPANYSLRDYLCYPVYDDWIPEYIPPYQIVQYTAQLAVDPADLRLVVNLKELGDYEFTGAALEYLRYVKNRAFVNTRSVIQLKVYEEDVLIDSEKLTLDSNLDVHCAFDLNLRKSYHIMVTIDSDLAKLSEQTVSELKEDGWFTENVLQVIYPQYLNTPVWPKPNDRGTISDLAWDRFVAALYPTNQWYRKPDIAQLTIGQFTILAKKRNDHGYR
ncbi:hypothetical protein MORTIMER_311 [Erwinia phage vB_EamM_Mortimer]|uniref:Uncharacterized protein n=2 Tax=Agricanvirus TaxID=1984776 RepID=A0A173GDQ2_9CAUD|nr:hypothetical protein FDH99_gp217 [Erwinia phage vB_EamM_Simmy50]ANH51767.1 hypothetical protein SIMMY50_309 [Erwinia phage vB_EamM_Simmy50]AUG87059.1 hypothetical protein MORTIMER_311 [Erwinia phage vB_EamM_Mortimer]